MNSSNRSNSKLENPPLEMFREVFQSYPGGQNEVVRMLLSLMLQHCGGCQHDGTKTLMKEVQTQTESQEIKPLEHLNNNKKKRRRRRKKRNSKNTNDNASSTEVDPSVDSATSNYTNASPDIPHQNPDNIELCRTEVHKVENRSKSYRSELLAQQYRSRYSRSSSTTSSTSSVSVSRSRSRSRRSSPSFQESRRITSARRLPVSYCRKSPHRGREKKRRRMRSATESSRSRSRSSGGRERSGSELCDSRSINRGKQSERGK